MADAPASDADQLYNAQMDLHQEKCRQRALVNRTFTPLLTDAIDALELGHPQIALSRLKRLREAMSKAVKEA